MSHAACNLCFSQKLVTNHVQGSFGRKAIFYNNSLSAVTSHCKIFDFRSMDLFCGEDPIKTYQKTCCLHAFFQRRNGCPKSVNIMLLARTCSAFRGSILRSWNCLLLVWPMENSTSWQDTLTDVQRVSEY